MHKYIINNKYYTAKSISDAISQYENQAIFVMEDILAGENIHTVKYKLNSNNSEANITKSIIVKEEKSTHNEQHNNFY